jgi:hypothetical protein
LLVNNGAPLDLFAAVRVNARVVDGAA